jgi:putative spermidine/putrescine transport system permease protein
MSDKRRKGFWPLAFVFAAFVLFLYGPVITIGAQLPGARRRPDLPDARLVAALVRQLWKGLGTVDIGAALRRSLALGVVVMLLTVLLSAAGRAGLPQEAGGGHVLFYVTVASLIMPSIVVSLGIGLQFRLLDDASRPARGGGRHRLLEGYTTSLGLYTSGLGAHLTWTLPFGLLIMFAVFNRFNPAYEKRRATWAPRRGRPSATWCCR